MASGAVPLKTLVMPDTRTQRGPHPKDSDCFAPDQVETLRLAVADLSWLRSRAYSPKASLKIVGDRYGLRDRQRKAVQRCAAGDADCAARERTRMEVTELHGQTLAVDGFNVLLSIEAALSGGVLLLGRDGTLRDLAAMSSHFRRVHTTRPAVALLAEHFRSAGVAEIDWYLDRPVSNSGRLRRLILETLGDRRPVWNVELGDGVDGLLAASPHVVATADSAILDRCERWFNLVRHVVEASIPEAWVLNLGTAPRGRQGESVGSEQGGQA